MVNKKCLYILFLFIMGSLLPVNIVFSQTSISRNSLYRIINSENTAPSELEEWIGLEMESYFNEFNAIFRFDISALRSPMNLRVFEDRNSYDAYVNSQLGYIVNGAIYLHFEAEERRELVLHWPPSISSEHREIIIYQSFIQFLRTFIPNPPSWILMGFASYFSPVNLNVRDMEQHMTGIAEILTSDMQNGEISYMQRNPNGFKISSWALVSFLLSGNRDYYRTLAESFLLLSPDSSSLENSELIYRRIFSFMDMDLLERDFTNYIFSYRSFNELINEGQRAFHAGRFREAASYFESAIEQRPSDFVPHYYLSLIAHNEGNYYQAERLLERSLENGADRALINYVLGINAIAEGRLERGAEHLHLAAGLNPELFRLRVENILRDIWR